MASLVWLNGLPGAGKSTLARTLVEDRRLALALDLDHLRSMLGGWRGEPGDAGLAIRALVPPAIGW